MLGTATNRKLKILIIVENNTRELLGFLLLKKKLEKKNFKIFFCNRHNFCSKYNTILPEVVITPQLFKIDGLQKLKNNSYLILLRAESHAGNNLFSLADFQNNNKKINPDSIFCWGNFDYKIFKKFFGNKNKIKIYKSGHPSIDIWDIFRKKFKSKKNNHSIGIVSTIRMINSSTSSKNPFAILDSITSNKDWFNKNIFLKNTEAGDIFVGYEYSFLNFILNFCKKYKKPISIRPFVNEDLKPYFYLNKYSNVKINKQYNYLKWLITNRTILSYNSSMCLTAYILGINVINIKNLLNKDSLKAMNNASYNFLFDKYFLMPKSYGELLKLIKDIKFKKNKKIERIIQDTYSYSSIKYEYSSDKILKFLEKNKKTISNKKPQPISSFKFTNNIFLNILFRLCPKKLRFFLIDTKIFFKNLAVNFFYNRQLYSAYNYLFISKIKKDFESIE